ncbi:hypothetical protein EGH21_12680 [Halomicroarcula sp. F13]|uniref:Lycopene cyclase domain-containing protein n=1 Tax=Haloarcula rubra TaxID=2487747 RepID=A0AAW4PRR0_9EURY|nr:hypothetical protein [Halomicroarcula rubra]MBX0323886.1 hypothetical protein [Halomicroarcula rubra]
MPIDELWNGVLIFGRNIEWLEPVFEIYPPLVLLGTYLAATGAYLIAADDLDNFVGLWLVMTVIYPPVLVWQINNMDMTRDIFLGYSLADSTVALPLVLMLPVAYILVQSLQDRFQEVA